ncbi:MAG: TetR family transcriptional regulator [Myxococcaceae bacterium]|jgi:hypothetical protein|nr:TetR family transcriptional regulator [Myxococcaceae bacterium]MCA3011758.1 TetR family transcriptional regulator [Myxococcaceae bacterium]
MSRLALVLAVSLLVPRAWAASGVEAMRGTAVGLRAQVASLRAEQLSRRNELSTVSSRIEGLKAQAKGALLSGPELDRALQRSQELSSTLTELAKQLSTRELELEAAHLALLDAITGELTRLRADFDRQTDRRVRRALIEQLRALRAERESIRAALPAAKLPSLDALRPSDDPEELLEQADLLRDNEEKVRRELKVLEARISQRRDEAELDRRVQRFLGEESMFDDQDRRLRVQRKEQAPGDAPLAGGKTANQGSLDTEADALAPSAPPSVTAGSAPADRPTLPPLLGGPAPQASRSVETTGFGAAPPATRGGTNFGTSSGAGALDSRAVTITSSSDARPQVGGGTGGVTAGDDDELETLTRKRRELEGLAAELARKAQDLEKKAGAQK